jgi:hypothetical protein
LPVAVVATRAAWRRAAAALGNGLEGAASSRFLVGVATLLLVALPYAVGDRPTPIDRWEAFAFLAIVGWIGLGWRIFELFGLGAFRFNDATRGLHQRSGPVDHRHRPGHPVTRPYS